MSDFENHYQNYLGIDLDEFKKGKRIYNKILKYNQQPGYSYYYMIITEFQTERVITIHPDFEEKFCKSELERLLKLNEEETIDFLNKKFGINNPEFNIRKMFRYSVNKNEFINSPLINEAMVMTEQHKDIYLTRVNFLDQEIQESIWKSILPMLNQKRAFICRRENDLIAEGSITTIIDNGGNIGVSTQNQYRKKGYGQAIVSQAVKWCFDNKIIPIYLVDQVNTNSILLAESLGFQLKSIEILISSKALGRNK